MSTVSIRRENEPVDRPRYRASAGNRQKFGATMGEALDALAAEWGDEAPDAVVLIQRFQPDSYFTEAQQQRKAALLARRANLNAEERAELERLLDVELDATVARTSRLAPSPSE